MARKNTYTEEQIKAKLKESSNRRIKLTLERGDRTWDPAEDNSNQMIQGPAIVSYIWWTDRDCVSVVIE